jgi:hypothetical protein
LTIILFKKNAGVVEIDSAEEDDSGSHCHLRKGKRCPSTSKPKDIFKRPLLMAKKDRKCSGNPKKKYFQLSLLWLVTFWQFQLPVLLPKEHFREEN